MKEFAKFEKWVGSEINSIEEWIKAQQGSMKPVIYCSVDVRYSGFKTIPVDTNLFPAGFNNLAEASLQTAAHAIQQYIQNQFGAVRKILLIPESFTRNTQYWRNLCALCDILSDAGYHVRCGVLEAAVLAAQPPCMLDLYEVQKNGKSLRLRDNWQPDLVLLNNDLSAGIPAILKYIAQPIVPHPQLGWHQRSKYQHSLKYAAIAQNCAKELGFDPWLIMPDIDYCANLNFKDPSSLYKLAEKVDSMIYRIAEQYKQRGITEAPYVYIKADHGTFGMGIMTARSGDEVLHINKPRRHSMYAIKQGMINSSVLLQEGVPTSLNVDTAPLENTFYFCGGQNIGALSRSNSKRDQFNNLNSRGAIVGPATTSIAPVQWLAASLAALAAAAENAVIPT
ncbi:MAG: glutamate--cysteine ligase [Proteobacteria bacterium]|nr:glutamate--cysteine ligase [Pseudomonadota bacterium]